MLQVLQTGKVLYALAAICALGIISKLLTSSLYKRLIKETGNMALTKNKNLKTLKQKTENVFLINHGIRNTTAYIEKQIYGFRFLKISLDSWDNFSMQAMILCFLTGGIAAFASYWYRCDSYYIVLYGAMGILSGLFMIFVDNGANVSAKRQQLSDCLVDYVENSPHFYRAVDWGEDGAEGGKKNFSTPWGKEKRGGLRPPASCIYIKTFLFFRQTVGSLKDKGYFPLIEHTFYAQKMSNYPRKTRVCPEKMGEKALLFSSGHFILELLVERNGAK